ncbi:MAG: glycogen synthase GlgA [Deltaproteobacteria bacterium]|nr:glycogen synthase GlgA [Deltaproteobacteria bacterium]
MKILFAASEATPYAKTGGLGDVCGALPKALNKLGCDVRLIIPFYRQIQESGVRSQESGEKSAIKDTGIQVSVNIGIKETTGRLSGLTPPALSRKKHAFCPTVYFLKCDEYYDREYLYSTPDSDYPDNLERFAFFSRGVLEAVKQLDFKPDIIHCHDWQTGLIPAYLKTVYKNVPFYANIKTLFTIHNIAYQGLFPSHMFPITWLPDYVFNPEDMEFWGQINLLKSGIVFSDMITTVSKKYCQEIQTPKFGFGLEGVLNTKKDKLFGILNGVDYDEWDPAKDKFIPANYTQKNLSGKILCRKALLKEYGLKIPDDIPLIGIISRFTSQKGFDILSEAMDNIMSMNIGMVVVGSGERKYSGMFESLAGIYPEKLGVKIAFDDKLAHMITAGCDMILMPSYYEPCGMTQMYALKYGTIPIVRATGGLDDTVQNFDTAAGSGNGFKFHDYSPVALTEKIKKALAAFHSKGAWDKLIQNAMSLDFSWEGSAKKYLELYHLIT